jgi:hypothetical protein
MTLVPLGWAFGDYLTGCSSKKSNNGSDDFEKGIRLLTGHHPYAPGSGSLYSSYSIFLCRALTKLGYALTLTELHAGSLISVFLDDFDAPDEFVLLLSGDGVVPGKHDKVVWRRGHEVGAKFVSVVRSDFALEN